MIQSSDNTNVRTTTNCSEWPTYHTTPTERFVIVHSKALLREFINNQEMISTLSEDKESKIVTLTTQIALDKSDYK